MNLKGHRYLGLPSYKPRVWVDLSSAASKRAGLAMHRPGRKVLQWAMKVIGWIAWLPIEKFHLGPIRKGYEIEGVVALSKIEPEAGFVTVYTGNDTVKSKLTIEVDGAKIVKLAKSKEAAGAVKQEVEVLEQIASCGIERLSSVVPKVLGSGSVDGWTWSAQMKVPRGKSPVRLQKEHYDFLELLKSAGLSHGDFAPWNCSIVDGKLYVYDWEDAGQYVEGKDEQWFKKQVKELLGVDA